MDIPLKLKYRTRNIPGYGKTKQRTNAGKQKATTRRPHFKAMKTIGESILALQRGTYGI